MWVNVMVESLEAEKAGVEKMERMNRCWESRQRRNKSNDALTQKWKATAKWVHLAVQTHSEGTIY